MNIDNIKKIGFPVTAVLFLFFPPVSQFVRVIFTSVYAVLPFLLFTLLIAFEKRQAVNEKQYVALNVQYGLVAAFAALVVYRLLYLAAGKQFYSFFIFFPFAVIGTLTPHLLFALVINRYHFKVTNK